MNSSQAVQSGAAQTAPKAGESHAEFLRQWNAFDWAATPFGPVEQWPAKIRAVIHDVLNSSIEPAVRPFGLAADAVEELQALIHLAPVGIFIAHDPACTRITMNPAGAAMLKMPVESNPSKSGPEEQTLPFRVLKEGREVPVDDLPMQRAARLKQSITAEEYDIVFSDDSVLVLYEYALPLFDSAGEVAGCLGVFVDITRRTQAEKGLRDSEERYRAFIANSSEGIWRLEFDPPINTTLPVEDQVAAAYRNGRLAECNETMAAMYGMPDAASMIGLTLDFMLPSSDPAARAYIASIVQAGYQVSDVDSCERNASGEEVFFSNSMAGDIEGGVLKRLWGTQRDITARKRIEEALSLRTEQFETLLSQAPIGVYLVDANLRILQGNPVALKAFNEGPAVIGRELGEVLATAWSADLAEVQTALFRRTLDTGDPHYERGFNEERLDRGVAECYDWEIHRIPLADGLNGVVCYFRDVSAEARARSAILESESRFRGTFENAAVGVAIVGLDGRWISTNEKVSSLTGWPREELLGHPLHDGSHPLNLGLEWAEVERLLVQENGASTFERRCLRMDGAAVWFNIHVSLQRDSSGQARNFILVMADITARMLAEEAARKGEQRLQFVGERAQVGYWDWDIATDVLEWSPVCKALFGIGPDESMSYKRFLEALHPADHERTDRAVQECLRSEGRSDYDIEYRTRWPDGSVRWIQAKGSATYAEGRPVRMAGIALDVTARKRADSLLVEQKQVLELIASGEAIEECFHALTDAVARLHPQAKACVLLANEEGTAMGMSYTAHLPPTFGQGIAGAPINELAIGTCGTAIFRGEVTTCADIAMCELWSRGWRDLCLAHGVHATHSVPVFSSTGEALGSFLLAFDEPHEPHEWECRIADFGAHAASIVIERDRAAAALHASTEEAHRLRLQAEAASNAKDDFLAALSHELRNPLTPVLLSASELALNTALPAGVREQIDMIRRNVALEARLIDDLLDLTHISHGKVAIHMVPLDVHQLLRHVEEIVRAEMTTRQVLLKLHLEARSHHVLADAARLQQVFWNLLKNAVKFTPDGGQIEVLTRSVDGRLFITVRDDGCGISSDALERIFRPFEQDRAHNRHMFGGLGLGLSISKALVELHHGALSVLSDGHGMGATFTVELGVTDAVVELTTTPPEAPSSGMRLLRLLVVDDHEATLDVMVRLLRGQGHEVRAASCVADALQLASLQEFDLVLSDLGLPDGSGMHLMSEIKSRHGWPGIALSGYGMEADLRKTSGAGFSAHLVKPVEISELFSAIERVMHGRGPAL